ncbi:DUF1648 domain-containing protein [Robinsoniella peoriensis]|uniref:DUF1648 domain-containing protein n=1 Tax=Robinsoniella peoriensis TaxID=180332 RepID=UPI00375155B0
MKIKNSKFDIAINMLCLIMIIGTAIYLIVNWTNIPENVPMHHNFSGEVDRFGNKSEMIILPILTVIMFSFMSVVEHFPQLWNTGSKVTDKNKEYVYRILKNMITTLKLIVVCVFTYLTMQTALVIELPSLFLPAFILILFGDMLFWILKLVKVNQKLKN